MKVSDLSKQKELKEGAKDQNLLIDLPTMVDRTSTMKFPRNEDVFEVEEILTAILSRLPVKSLLVCRSVCKSWNTIISGPYFRYLHLTESRENPSYIFYPDTHLSPTNMPPLTKIDRETSRTSLIWNEFFLKGMLCSFNGLVCRLNYSYSRTDESGAAADINICNPATRQTLKLPPAPVSEPADPTCFSKVGVSFRATMDAVEYKVFQFFCRGGGGERTTECLVYSSIARTWKHIGCFPYCPTFLRNVCIDGTGYWLGKWTTNDRKAADRVVIAVDWEEQFSVIGVPEEEDLSKSFLIDLESNLGMVVLSRTTTGSSGGWRFGVWVLQDRKESVWVKKVSSDSIGVSGVDSVRFVGGGRNEIVFGSREQYLFYNIQSRSWREYKWEGGGGGFTAPPLEYTESLLPPW